MNARLRGVVCGVTFAAVALAVPSVAQTSLPSAPLHPPPAVRSVLHPCALEKPSVVYGLSAGACLGLQALQRQRSTAPRSGSAAAKMSRVVAPSPTDPVPPCANVAGVND